MNNTNYGYDTDICAFHYMLKEAGDQGQVWLATWITTAVLTTVLSLVAIVCLLGESIYGSTNRYLKLSMFGSHLLTGIIVLPMLALTNNSSLPACVHQIVLTFFASMTHFLSCISVMLLSTYIHGRVSQNQPTLSFRRRNSWKLAAIVSWILSLAVAVIPIFLPVSIYLLPILITALLLTTYRQVRTIICLRPGRMVPGTNAVPVVTHKYLAEKRLARLLLLILLMNLMFTLVPYAALISDLKGFVRVASKLPFFKSLIEEIIYFWVQKTWRRRVIVTLQKWCTYLLSAY